MRLLLDTHALIWVVVAPAKLSEPVKSALTADDAEVFASHVSLWEMAIKAGQGRLDVLDRSAFDWFEHYIPASGLKVLQISAEQIGAVENLPELHRDPFDRLLVTQAVVSDFKLVTKDRLIQQYDVPTLW